MTFLVNLDRDETGMIVAECPAIPGCISQGATEPEALCKWAPLYPLSSILYPFGKPSMSCLLWARRRAPAVIRWSGAGAARRCPFP